MLPCYTTTIVPQCKEINWKMAILVKQLSRIQVIVIFRKHSKKTQNLKSSYLLYFMGKKSWNLKCKFRYGFFIALSKKNSVFLFQAKKVFWDRKTNYFINNSNEACVLCYIKASKLINSQKMLNKTFVYVKNSFKINKAAHKNNPQTH